jgi:hypothetical protein
VTNRWPLLFIFSCSGSWIVGFLRGKVSFALPKRFRFASEMFPEYFRSASEAIPRCFRFLFCGSWEVNHRGFAASAQTGRNPAQDVVNDFQIAKYRRYRMHFSTPSRTSLVLARSIVSSVRALSREQGKVFLTKWEAGF